jgi:hypothetical protein
MVGRGRHCGLHHSAFLDLRLWGKPKPEGQARSGRTRRAALVEAFSVGSGPWDERYGAGAFGGPAPQVRRVVVVSA